MTNTENFYFIDFLPLHFHFRLEASLRGVLPYFFFIPYDRAQYESPLFVPGDILYFGSPCDTVCFLPFIVTVERHFLPFAGRFFFRRHTLFLKGPTFDFLSHTLFIISNTTTLLSFAGFFFF